MRVIVDDDASLSRLIKHSTCAGMLAQNCLAPGFSTMFYLLTTSIPDSATKWLKKKNMGSWVSEYIEGYVQVFDSALAPSLTGNLQSDDGNLRGMLQANSGTYHILTCIYRFAYHKHTPACLSTA